MSFTAAEGENIADLNAIADLVREENVRVIAPGRRPVFNNVTIDYADGDGDLQQWVTNEFADYNGDYTAVA